MWYEILPCAAIITMFMAIPSFGMYGINKLVIDNSYRRNLDKRFDRVMYQRDFRITNNPYVMNGLNSIPDEEE